MLVVVAASLLVAAAVVVVDRPRQRARDRSKLLHGRRIATTRVPRSSVRAREGLVLHFVDAVVAELDAGAPPTRAVQAAAAALQHDPVFAAMGRQVSLGGDAVAALTQAALAPGGGALLRVAACAQVTARSGAGLGGALRRVAAGIRDELALRREVAGQLAAPRATAKLLAGLPLVVWLMGYGLGSDPLSVLLTTPYGWACLVIGVGLEWIGVRWVERLARGVSPR